MNQWINDNQDFIKFLFLVAFLALGIVIGRMSKHEDLTLTIEGYESLLNRAYEERENLLKALAAPRDEYLGYRVSNHPSVQSSIKHRTITAINGCPCATCNAARGGDNHNIRWINQ